MKKQWLGFCLLFAFSLSAAPKEWTFFIYINGHNSLDKYGAININQMEMVGSNDKLNVVVQWASLDSKTTKRLYITKDSDNKNVTSKVIEELPRVDMGDFRSLTDFLKWGHKNYPANHYFVNVWNHGTGWNLVTNVSDVTDDISYDDITGHFISTRELGEVLSEFATLIGHKIDIFGTDACLMAMAEVAAEIESSTRVFVSSEDEEPGSGWPYHLFLERWTKNMSASAAEIATILVNAFTEYYSDKKEVTLSAFDLSKFYNLRQSLSSLAYRLQLASRESKAKLREVTFNVQTFARDDYKDIGQWMSEIQKQPMLSSFHSYAKMVEKDLKGFTIAYKATQQYKDVSGLSIWIPFEYEYRELVGIYKQLKFAKTTWWTQFLSYYVKG